MNPLEAALETTRHASLEALDALEAALETTQQARDDGTAANIFFNDSDDEKRHSGFEIVSASASEASTELTVEFKGVKGFLTEQLAATATATTPAASAASTWGVQHGLSSADIAAYESLWAEAGAIDGLLASGPAVKLLGTSGLHQTSLNKIWSLAKVSGAKSAVNIPHDKLNEVQFFTAIKLVAVKQSGGDISLRSISTKTPLPKIGKVGTECSKSATSSPKRTDVHTVPARASNHSDNVFDVLLLHDMRNTTAYAAHGPQQAYDGPPTPPHARKLGLSHSDVKHYDALWEQASTEDDALAVDAAVQFLCKAGLPQADLLKIWGLSDFKEPKGKLSKGEFFVALKLVALKQSGGAISMANCANEAPLPKMGANQGRQTTATASSAPSVDVAAGHNTKDITNSRSMSKSPPRSTHANRSRISPERSSNTNQSTGI